jgi:C4-dicarboxylate transporter DctM subunit
MVQGRLPNKFGAGVITHRRGAGHPDPAVHRHGDVLGGHQHLGARLFMAGVVPGLALAATLGGVTWYRARKFDSPSAQGVGG